MKITNPITLDVARSNSYICLLAKQFDSNSRYLEITLADNGQPLTIPADASVVLRATRADGTGAVVSGTVANGKAAVEIDDYILEVAGAVTLSLEISKGGEILTTTHCNLTVQKADASGWIRVYIADSSKAAGNYYITIGGVSYSFTTSQAIPAGGSVYFSSNNATAETRDATGAVIETGLVLTEGTTGTQLVTDVPTMSFLATIAGRVAALESEMPNKADKDGIIALANNLAPYSSASGATQSTPFIAQEPGTGNGESVVNVGSYAQVKKKLGNTVCVNQLIPIPTNSLSKTENGVTFTDNRDGTYTVQTTAEGATADTYITVYDQTTDHARRTCILFGAPSGASATTHFLNDAMGSIGRDTGMGVIGNVYSNGRVIIRITVKSGAIITTPVTYRPKLCDLSLWYGSTGRIPAHLLSHPEDFSRYYSGSLAANPGQLVNADGSVLTSIGRNVFDKSTAVANERWKASGTEYASGTTRSDYIPCIPNTTYYFKDIHSTTTLGSAIYWFDADKNYISAASLNITSGTATAPSNARYVGINLPSTSLDTCCVSLYYPYESGYDQYYPYSVLAEVDTGSEMLRSAGAVADEKLPSGVITRAISAEITIDLTSLTFVAQGGGQSHWYSSTQPFASYKLPASNSDTANARCNKLCVYAYSDLSNNVGMGITSTGRLGISNEVYQNLASYGTITVICELATPTTEQGTPFAENIPCDDFGSMYWTQTNGVPQGVEIFYPYDYKAAVDTILNEVNGDVTKLVTSEKVPDAPSSNGTYVLKVTVSGGTPAYSWVAE